MSHQHQLTVTLTDEEYAALAAEAERSGTPIEAIAHERLSNPREASEPAREAIQQRLRRQRLLENIPTGEPDTPEEEAEAEHLAQLFGGGKSGAEMVIEDRGPSAQLP